MMNKKSLISIPIVAIILSISLLAIPTDLPNNNDENNTTISPYDPINPDFVLRAVNGTIYLESEAVTADSNKLKLIGEPLHTIDIDLNYGVEIYWNESNVVDELVRVAITLDFNVSTFYIRNQYNYSITLTASIIHNVECNFTISVDARQLEFPPGPISPPFELSGTVYNESRDFSTWLNSTSQFDYSIDGMIIPRLVLCIPNEIGYHTIFTISHAYIEVYANY